MSSVSLFKFMQSYFLKISIQCCCRINFQLKIYFCHMAHILTKWPTSWHSQHKVLKFCLMKLKRTKICLINILPRIKSGSEEFCTEFVLFSVQILCQILCLCLLCTEKWKSVFILPRVGTDSVQNRLRFFVQVQ